MRACVRTFLLLLDAFIVAAFARKVAIVNDTNKRRAIAKGVGNCPRHVKIVDNGETFCVSERARTRANCKQKESDDKRLRQILLQTEH